MPDALETLMEQVPEPPASAASFKEADVLERYKGGFGPKEPVVESPAAPPEPPKETTPPATAESDIPPELLGITKETPKPEEDIFTIEPKGQLKNENYKRLQAEARTRIEAEKAEKAAIKKELEELRSRYTDDYVPEKISKELEYERKTRIEREEELGRIAVERSPLFKQQFTAKQDGLFRQLQKTGEELGLHKDIAAQLIHSSATKRFELLEDLEINGAAKGYISSLLQQHDQVETDKATFLEDWKGKAEQMQRDQEAQTNAEKAKLKAYEDKVFDSTLERLSKTFAPLRKIEGNDKWNQGIDNDIAVARKFHDGEFTTEEFDEVILAGVGAKRLYSMYEKVLGMYQESAKELAGLKSASPSAPPPGSKPPIDDDSKLSFEERAKRTFDRIVASAANQG